MMKDPESAVRYWTATAGLVHGRQGVQWLGRELREALRDESPSVRVVAAEALGRYGTDADCRDALSTLLELSDVKRSGIYLAVAALNALDAMDRLALPESDPAILAPMKEYIPALKKAILADLQ